MSQHKTIAEFEPRYLPNYIKTVIWKLKSNSNKLKIFWNLQFKNEKKVLIIM